MASWVGSWGGVYIPIHVGRPIFWSALLLALLRVSEVHVHDPVFTRLELFVCDGPLAGRAAFRFALASVRFAFTSSQRRFRVRGCAFV